MLVAPLSRASNETNNLQQREQQDRNRVIEITIKVDS